MEGKHSGRQQVLLDYSFTHSFEESARLILEMTAEEVRSPMGLFVVYEDNLSSMSIAAAVGIDERHLSGTQDPLSMTATTETGDWGQSLASSIPIVHSQPCRSPLWPFSAARDATVSSAVYVPMVTPVHARVVLSFFGREEAYTQEDVRAIEEIAVLPVRIAFEERRLFELREIRSIYDSVIDGLFTLSVEPEDVYRFTSVNRSFLEETGLGLDQVIGRDFREVLPKDTLDHVLKRYRQAVSERGPVRWEETTTFPTGARYVQVSVNPLYDKHDNCTHLIGTVHDVTDYRLAELEVRAANEKYHTFFENSMDAIFLATPDGQVLETNRAACEMLGRTQEELRRLGRSAIIDSSDPRLRELLEGRRRTGKARGELSLRRKDGSSIPVEVSLAMFTDAHGSLRASTVARDISERVSAQAEIEQRERYYRALIENAADIILVVSEEGVITYCSPSVERQLGFNPEAVVGRSIGEVLEVTAGGETERALEAVINSSEATVPVTATATASNQETRYFSGAARNAVSEETVRGIVINLRDVSSQVQSNRERERLRDELEQARKMESVGRLAGGVAHDFNNQLTVILGHSDLALSRVEEGDPLHDDLAAIRSAASRSGELTRQLLAFARRQSISPQVVELNRTVDGMIKMLRRLIGENIELVWNPGASPSTVKLDPVQVNQILVNLCLNARDAIETSGRITISTRSDRFEEGQAGFPEAGSGKFVMLSVSDTGAGMDQETLAQVFEPFFTTKGQGRGTGLGAATVYGIVQQNSGHISVSSEVGSGTTFNLYFPMATGRGDEPMARSEAMSIAGRGETILLVEDDATILDTTSKILLSLGYQVIGTTSATEAIGIVQKHNGTIDLIITDVVMPTMNGKELIDRLKGLSLETRTLFVSGYAADVSTLKGVLDDNVNFLQKPYRIPVLAAKVREVLSS